MDTKRARMARMAQVLDRGAELSVLEEVVRGLGESRGCLALVGGEAGIGKTTLVRAVRARMGGAVEFLVGMCEPMSVPVPLGPVRELAVAVGDADPTEPVARRPGRWSRGGCSPCLAPAAGDDRGARPSDAELLAWTHRLRRT